MYVPDLMNWFHYHTQSDSDLKSSLNVSLEEQIRIEGETRNQSSQKEWYVVRSKRITGSKCGRILNQQKKSVSLLKQCLYPNPLNPPPPPIAWGHQNESRAIAKYVTYMTKEHNSSLSGKVWMYYSPK